MTIKFHDVSHYQGDYMPTGPTIAKATEATTFVDPRWKTTQERCRAAGYPFLPYHFLTHGDIAAQVAHVIATIGHGSNLMLDVESEPGRPDPTLHDVLDFCDLYAQRSGGRVVLDYIPEWFWRGHWGSPSLTPIVDRGAGLVSSHYTAYSDTGAGWRPYGGVTPVIWQFTSTPIDTNAFRGTLDELTALITGGDDMPTGIEIFNADCVPNPSWRADSPDHTPKPAKPNSTTQVDFALGDMWTRVGDTQFKVNDLLAMAAAQGKQISALVATINTLATAGTSVDTAAVIAAINDEGARESEAVTALQRQVQALQDDLTTTKATLAAALAAAPSSPAA